ncbi:hypothetical protein ACP4OV_018388 [Aristida adscensionis]
MYSRGGAVDTQSHSEEHHKITQTTAMAMFAKNTSQSLLLLSFVLLACLAIPALSGRSMDSNKSEMNAVGRTCLRVEHSDSSVGFCCSRLHKCWPSMQECGKYCCGGKVCPQPLKGLDQ